MSADNLEVRTPARAVNSPGAWPDWLESNVNDAIPARICSRPDCDLPQAQRDLCRSHYVKAWRAGTLPPLWTPLEFPVTEYAEHEYAEPYRARFWTRVDASGDCWEWTGGVNYRGYGLAGAHEPGPLEIIPAHRFAWEMLVGQIPDGYQIDHRCFNEGCVNPDHLEPVPPKVNAARRRWNPEANKTHCIRGHAFDEANTRVRILANGMKARRCIACQNERNAARPEGHG